MSSPIGEPPIRRHLASGVSALMVQTIRAARRRTLKRQAILRERSAREGVPLDNAPVLPMGAAVVAPSVPDVGGAPLRVLPQGEGGVRAASVPDLPVTASDRPRHQPPGSSPGTARSLPLDRSSSSAGATAAEGPAPAEVPRPVLNPPPLVRLMTAALARTARAAALAREALAPGAPARARPTVSEATAPGVGHPPLAVTAAARSPISRLETQAVAAPQPQMLPANGPPSAADHGIPALQPPRIRHPDEAAPSPAFGPHPGPPAPPPAFAGATAAEGVPTHEAAPVPARASEESSLLAEERLREQLARILRADALRHGLDLKER